MALDLPPREEIRDYLLSFDLFEQVGRPQEGQMYVDFHLERMIKTLLMIPHLPGRARVLELGASPFFMSLLVMKYLNYELVPANYCGDYGQPTANEVEERVTSERFGETHTFRYKVVNVETDPFPYATGEFDIALCCELLEHLILDPSHMLREIHRVLKPGGHVIITTPNVICLEKMLSLLKGRFFLPPYSGLGVYGRHNREYTPCELHNLLELHNFTASIAVENVYAPHSLLHRLLTPIGPLRWRRDTIFARGRAHGDLAQRYPEWLYVQQWARRAVVRNEIAMGDGDIFQLGSGWHDIENRPPNVRWTGREATVYLKPQRQETTLGLRVDAGPRPAHGEVFVQDQRVGDYTLEAKHLYDLRFPLPEEVQDKIAAGALPNVEVRIVVAAPFVPGPHDPRELGVAVERIWLE